MLREVLLAACAVAFVTANQLDNNVDVGATVKEVENMLARDPRLPRLTRGEILKLIDEVRTGKEVVVVLPDNQAAIDYNTSSTTKRPVKRRRKKPVVRPVYVHSTTESALGSSTEPGSGLELNLSSTEPEVSGLDFSPSSTFKPRVRTTTKPPVVGGGLPPIPGLSLVDGINSWGPVKQEEAMPVKQGSGSSGVFITPLPPTASSTTESTSSSPSPNNPDALPNVKVAAESLGPEMKDLLTRFGLLGSETTTERSYQAGPAPTIDPEVYSRFKPLPVKSTADFVSPDMKSFLASYGLLDTRQGKDLKPESTEAKNTPLDYIPNHDKEVLEQLGLWRDGKAVDVGAGNLASLDVKKPSNSKTPKHVFKPKKVEEANGQEELQKVNKILTKLKEIGEGKDDGKTALSPSDVEELLLLEDNTRLAAQEQVGLGDEAESFEEKNEVKRNPQDSSVSVSANANAESTADVSGDATTQSDVSTEASATTTTETSSSTDSMPSESEDTTERGASAIDLADSFGGGGITTTKRPNGFYFLLDWNSFLDVGLDDPPGRAIHLNFSPKVGNPANFLPVTIGNSQSRRR